MGPNNKKVQVMDAYQKLLTEEDFDLLLVSPHLLFYIHLGDIPMFQVVFQNPLLIVW